MREVLHGHCRSGEGENMSDSNTIQHVQHVESVEKDINVLNKRVAICRKANR